jgi:hypothetical protein
MPSLKRHEGYLEIDHRFSPGISDDDAVKLGYMPGELSEGTHFEAATLSCKHCGSAWYKNPRRVRPRGYCRKCDHYICDTCETESLHADYVHRSREEILDAAMTSASRGQSFDPMVPKSPTIVVP